MYAVVKDGVLKRLAYYDQNHNQEVSIDLAHPHNGVMPLVYSDSPDTSAIDETSRSIDVYIQENEESLLHGIKNYLLEAGDMIAEEIGW